jgi:hypothetical protein
MMRGLRMVLVLDAAVLLLLGAALIAAPELAATAFGLEGLPVGVHYLVGTWGCALLTMGIGYVAAAQNPVRHVVWVQVGIARGVLECLVGLWYVMQGVVTLRQAGPGIVVAALMAVAYTVLHPRAEPVPALDEAVT